MVRQKCSGIRRSYLGPQVRYQKAEVEEIVNGRIPVLVINMKDYGSMNGKAVLETALAAIQ